MTCEEFKDRNIYVKPLSDDEFITKYLGLAIARRKEEERLIDEGKVGIWEDNFELKEANTDILGKKPFKLEESAFSDRLYREYREE